jgi:signal transduction histidine kinase
VVRNIQSIRSSIAETESLVQSYLLTGDQQWKKNLSGVHGRLLRTLEETAALEADALQQKKILLVKQALQNKIAFQQTIMKTDSITPELKQEMGYHGLNRRFTTRIHSPLGLLTERQELLLQRRTEANADAAAYARFLTIFSAVFVYMCILYALWFLRKQSQPGPAMKMFEEENESTRQYKDDHDISPALSSGFHGVFSIHEGYRKDSNDKERTGIVRVLWSKQELEKNFSAAADVLHLHQIKRNSHKNSDVLHLHQETGHYLGNAVNANYFQPGSSLNRLPNGHIPGITSSFNLHSAPYSPNISLPSQEQPGFQLAELVQTVLAAFYAEAEEKNIRLLHTVDPAIPKTLSGDAEKLRRILNDLLENAIRFTFKGYVQLTISGIKISKEQVEIAFSVADTGKGIDPDKMQNLLYGDGTQVPVLANARKLVESQHNQMMIHSTEEDGTVCCFTSCFRL